MKTIIISLWLFGAMAAVSQAQSHRFKYAGDSLVCYQAMYYKDKEQKWHFSITARYLPSGKKIEGNNRDILDAIQADSSFCMYYPEKYYYVSSAGFGRVNKSGTGYSLLGRTRDAVLATVGNSGFGLLQFDGSGLRSFAKAESVEKAHKENRKQYPNSPWVSVVKLTSIWGVAAQKRMYYSHLGALYSIADDGSDDSNPRQELPASGGMAIMNLRMSPNGRYALMELASMVQSGNKTIVNANGWSTGAIRCFDLKEKRPVMDVKPTRMDRLEFSPDDRYILYWNENDERYCYYDLQEKAEIGRYPVTAFTDDYHQHRMEYTIDGRYFYRVSGVPDSYGERVFSLKIVDLRSVPLK